MSTKKKHPHHPHAPKPQGEDAVKRVYKVEDATGRSFGAGMTWDEAWRRKEEVAGQRKSTTPRIVKIGQVRTATGGGWSEQQRHQSAQAAARAATPAAPLPLPSIAAGPHIAQFDQTDELSRASAAADMAAMTGAPAAWRTPPEEALDVGRELVSIDDGEADDEDLESDDDDEVEVEGNDDDIDSLVDEANEAAPPAKVIQMAKAPPAKAAGRMR